MLRFAFIGGLAVSISRPLALRTDLAVGVPLAEGDPEGSSVACSVCRPSSGVPPDNAVGLKKLFALLAFESHATATPETPSANSADRAEQARPICGWHEANGWAVLPIVLLDERPIRRTRRGVHECRAGASTNGCLTMRARCCVVPPSGSVPVVFHPTAGGEQHQKSLIHRREERH
jgi:hypothetical protein